MPAATTVAGIVLCGGRSRRMGQPKHLLPFGGETTLQRVVRVVSSVVSPVVVVASSGQELPELPDDVRIIRDAQEHQGPLAGLCRALTAIADEAEAAYLTGCDVPLLKAEFIREIMSRLTEQDDAVVPVDDRFLHPLAGVYRCRLLPLGERLVEADELRPRSLIESCRTVRLHVDELRCVDPELDSLRNMNTREDYDQLLDRAGIRTDSQSSGTQGPPGD